MKKAESPAAMFVPPDTLRESVLKHARSMEEAQSTRREAIRSVLARGGRTKEALGVSVTRQTGIWLRQSWLPKQVVPRRPRPKSGFSWRPVWALATCCVLVWVGYVAVSKGWFAGTADEPSESSTVLAQVPVQPKAVVEISSFAVAEAKDIPAPLPISSPPPALALAARADARPALERAADRTSSPPPPPVQPAAARARAAAETDNRNVANAVAVAPSVAVAPPAPIRGDLLTSAVSQPEPRSVKRSDEASVPAAMFEQEVSPVVAAPAALAAAPAPTPAPEVMAQADAVSAEAKVSSEPVAASESVAVSAPVPPPMSVSPSFFYPVGSGQWKRVAARLATEPARAWRLQTSTPDAPEIRSLAASLRQSLPAGATLDIQTDTGLSPGFVRLVP